MLYSRRSFLSLSAFTGAAFAAACAPGAAPQVDTRKFMEELVK